MACGTDLRGVARLAAAAVRHPHPRHARHRRTGVRDRALLQLLHDPEQRAGGAGHVDCGGDGGGARSAFFTRADVRGAVALYIGVTGTIYVTILRHLWQPQGAQWWADIGLHYATPLSYLAWWTLGVRHGALQWRDVLRWLLFPLAYLLWSLARGAWVHEYPYPFIDVDALGWALVLRNAAGVRLVFVALGAIAVAVDRRLRLRLA